MQPQTHARAGGVPPRLPPARIACVALAALPLLALLGCGSNNDADGSSAGLGAKTTVKLAAPRCADATARALGTIAHHVYHEIAGGRIALPAARRLASAPTLRAAAEAGDPAAARAALVPLLRNQLVRVRVTVGGRILTEYGTAAGIAPVSTPLKDAAGATIGTVVVSEQGVLGYSDTVHTITGATVIVRAGSSTLGGSARSLPSELPNHGEISYRGANYAVYSFPGTGFPALALRTYVLAPVPPASSCASTPAQTAANAIGASAMKIYSDEQSGSATLAVVRAFERSRAFQQAVATDDPLAARATIVAFFETTMHVVRVRATLGEKLVADVGGPHVLAPIRGDVRDKSGRIVGHFLLSVQDDLGYTILTHRFTGAQVLLRQGSQQIVGNLTPGPAQIPIRGNVLYHGVHYQAYSFTAQAFPSGELRVSLLIPPVPGT
jgi:hypothetical protein